MRRPRAWMAGLGLTVLSIGCEARRTGQVDQRAPDISSSKDSIRIVSISPDPGSPLRVGASVTFRVEVGYTLASADAGTVTLVIQRGESGSMPIGNETQVVQRGSGNIVLTKTADIPDTAAVQVFTPLTPQAGTSTNVVDTRAYRVVKS